MPRGRPREVRYFLDEITGNVIALGQGAMRVLKEIGGGVSSGRKSGPKLSKTGKRIGRPPKAASADPMAPAPAQAKKRGRPKKAKSS